VRLQKKLEPGVAAVAKRRIGAVLATAEVNGFGFCGLELNRLELAPRVATIAKRLAGASTTGAPVITLASFDGHGKRAFLCNLGFRHGEFSSNCSTEIIADFVELRRHSAGNALDCGFEFAGMKQNP
jgi:hypothetical protein